MPLVKKIFFSAYLFDNPLNNTRRSSEDNIWHNMVSYQYTWRVDKNIYKSVNLDRALFCFCL